MPQLNFTADRVAIFCFPAPQDLQPPLNTFSDRLQPMILLINNVFLDPKKSVVLEEQGHVWCEFLLRTDQALKKQLDKPWGITLACKIKHTMTFFFPPALRDRKLAEIIELLEKRQDKTPEEWWYYGIALLQVHTRRPNMEVINALIDCIVNIPMEQFTNLKKALFVDTLDQFIKTDGYPENNPFARLSPKFWHLFDDNAHALEGACAIVRHNYIKKTLVQHKTYFSTELDRVLPPQPSQKLQKKLHISEQSSLLGRKCSFQVSLNQGLFDKFAAHIVTLSPPIPKITYEGTSTSANEKFNEDLRQRLLAAKRCNAEGFLYKDLFQDDAFKQFVETVANCFADYFKQSKITRTELMKHVRKHLDQENLKRQYDQLIEHKKKRQGFKPLHALQIFDACLIEHELSLPQELRERTKRIVRHALEINDEADKINRSSQKPGVVDLATHEQWFKLAGQIVTFIFKEKQSVLLQVGMPIIQGGEAVHHTFYVLLKFLNNNPETIQVIITNGGLYYAQFHEPIPEVNQKEEWPMMRYAAFKPVLLNTESKDALTHYVYRVISLRYTRTGEDDLRKTGKLAPADARQTNPGLLSNVLRDIYLRSSAEPKEPEFFFGYRGHKCEIFQREDLPKGFLIQLFGNCTVHNLKKTLQILFDMDELTFGLLEDNLVLGLDHLIGKYHHLTPSAALHTSGQTLLSALPPPKAQKPDEATAEMAKKAIKAPGPSL